MFSHAFISSKFVEKGISGLEQHSVTAFNNDEEVPENTFDYSSTHLQSEFKGNICFCHY